MMIAMRRISKLLIIAALLGGIVLAGIVLRSYWPTPKVVTRRALTDTVGVNAIDCGWSAIGHDRSKQRDCVLAASHNRIPFIALYGVQGKEEPYVVGLAGDHQGGGHMLDVEAGDNFRKLYREATKNGNHLQPQNCPSPLKLKVVEDGIILCFPN